MPINVERMKTMSILSKEEIVKLFNSVYEKVNDGIPNVVPPVEEFAKEYADKYKTNQIAAKEMHKTQIVKCTTSGFLTGFGGLITLPVTIPANIASVLYVQMRMIAATAYMGGFDLRDDQVQTFVYACLAGVSVNQVIKRFGVQFGNKLALKGIEKIPGKVLTKINQKIGFRFLTKFGEKGMINLWKLIPVVGAVVNGGFDLVETKIIAERAYKMFIEKDFTVGEELKLEEEDFVVIDDADEPEHKNEAENPSADENNG